MGREEAMRAPGHHWFGTGEGPLCLFLTFLCILHLATCHTSHWHPQLAAAAC